MNNGKHPGNKTHVLCDAIFMLEVIVLPRQARDEHRESTEKRDDAFSYRRRQFRRDDAQRL
eukprot:COSAG06_NODE_29702_length_551_cov_3.285398_2_plen_60_part_01